MDRIIHQGGQGRGGDLGLCSSLGRMPGTTDVFSSFPFLFISSPETLEPEQLDRQGLALPLLSQLLSQYGLHRGCLRLKSGQVRGEGGLKGDNYSYSQVNQKGLHHQKEINWAEFRAWNKTDAARK